MCAAEAARGPIMFARQFANDRDASILAYAIVDTVREPFIVLDHDHRVVAANRSFYLTFAVGPNEAQGRLVYELGDGEWDIPELRAHLRRVSLEQDTTKDCEIEHNFTDVGRRILRLNARKMLCEAESQANILLGIEDITSRRALEREDHELLRQKDVQLKEQQHRVANSLQIIASILMIKANSVESEDARRLLHDAHSRVVSVAAIQRHLEAFDARGTIELGPYLNKLCEALSQAMIGDHTPISLTVCGEGTVATCRKAESVGLIVTELVINSLKHAFDQSTTDGRIDVSYGASGTDWKLTIADNGVGRPLGVLGRPKAGLGTSIVKALAKQLDARVVTSSNEHGTTVSIVHATFGAAAPISLSKTRSEVTTSSVPSI